MRGIGGITGCGFLGGCFGLLGVRGFRGLVTVFALVTVALDFFAVGMMIYPPIMIVNDVGAAAGSVV